jgi:transposase
LYREGVSVSAISSLTGFDRKTIRKYLHAGGIPRKEAAVGTAFCRRPGAT